MATKKPSRPDDAHSDDAHLDAENGTPATPTDERFSPEILAECTINPPQERGRAGFVQAFCELLRTLPDVPYTREMLTTELVTLTGRRPAPPTLDRILRAAVRTEMLASGTRKATGDRVWVIPTTLPSPDDMVAKLRDALVGHG